VLPLRPDRGATGDGTAGSSPPTTETADAQSGHRIRLPARASSTRILRPHCGHTHTIDMMKGPDDSERQQDNGHSGTDESDRRGASLSSWADTSRDCNAITGCGTQFDHVRFDGPRFRPLPCSCLFKPTSRGISDACAAGVTKRMAGLRLRF